MSKFNGTTKTSIPSTTNLAGGVSYERVIKKEIASVVLNSMLKGDSFYEKEKDRIKRIETLIGSATEDELAFVAKAMIYTRAEGKLRSITHLLAVLLAEKVKGQPFLKSSFMKTFIRPDDMTEVLSLWNIRNPGKMIPNSLRRAFKASLETKFDEYQFKKYAGERLKTKLRDVVKLSHPSPKNFVDKDVFKKIIESRLDNIETAQTINAGKTGEERVDAYIEQIKSGKMGYMAAVKNIRTLLENGISIEDLNIWCDFITDKKKVERSMMLPFRFVDAWLAVKDLVEKPKTLGDVFNEMQPNYGLKSQLEKVLGIEEEVVEKQTEKLSSKLPLVKKALEKAFAISAGNTSIVDDGEKVAILLDESGSMGGHPGSPFHIGKILSTAIKVGMPFEDCKFYTWANQCVERKVEGSPFEFISKLNSRGGGTDVSAPLQLLLQEEVFVDSIVILTDLQMYSGRDNIGDTIKRYINQYRGKINPNVKVLFWNLEGLPCGMPIDLEKTPEIFEIAGYSDSMLQIIPKLWKDKDFLIKEIEAIEI